MPAKTHYAPLTDEVFDTPPTKKDLWTIPLSQELTFGPNSAFIGNFQFAYDATSLDLFRTCPRKYQLTMLEGWHQKSQPPPLRWGIAYHTCMETWHKLLFLKPPTEQTDEHKTWCLHRVVRLAGLLGETLPPGDITRTKETLIRSVVWYLDQFWNDRTKTIILSDGKPAVEYSFMIPLTELEWNDSKSGPTKKVQIYYCGHIDRLISYARNNYPTDFKSTGYLLNAEFFEAFKPNGQMSGYNIAGHVLLKNEGGVDGIVIDGIQLGVNFTRFQRTFISYTPEEIEEDIQDIKAWIGHVQKCAEENYWPKNPTSCGRFFKTQEREIINTGCHFREICSKPPHIRPTYLKGNFVKQTWDPLKSR